MRVLSLGWGVQSWTLAAMAALGEIPPFDALVHADTGHEREGTYRFAERWTPWLESRGQKVITVHPTNNQVINGVAVHIPAFAKKLEGRGQIRRQCTREWKVRPIRRWLQEHRNGECVELCLGISLDEFKRMKPSDVKYIEHRWPLVDLRLTRADCLTWLKASYLPAPVKSGCVFCPYHDNGTWEEIRIEDGQDWKKAIGTDLEIRKGRPPFDLFLHQYCEPLAMTEFVKIHPGQLSLWDLECSGVCGI